jgi:hypothetical protein
LRDRSPIRKSLVRVHWQLSFVTFKLRVALLTSSCPCLTARRDSELRRRRSQCWATGTGRPSPLAGAGAQGPPGPVGKPSVSGPGMWKRRLLVLQEQGGELRTAIFPPRNYARNQEEAGIEEAGLVQSRHEGYHDDDEAGRDEKLSSQKSARRAFQRLRPGALKTRRAAPQARPAAGFAFCSLHKETQREATSS